MVDSSQCSCAGLIQCSLAAPNIDFGTAAAPVAYQLFHQHACQRDHTAAVQEAKQGHSTLHPSTMHHSGLTMHAAGDPCTNVICAKVHYEEQCTMKGCVWCRNIYSPWPGSQGVCDWEDKAKELPQFMYKCHHVKPKETST